MSLTVRERAVMAHATAWDTTRHRNNFVTGEETDDWKVLQELEGRGLVKMAPTPKFLNKSDRVFFVTEAGKQALREHGAGS